MFSFFLQGIAFALFAFLPGMTSFVVSSVIMGLTLRATYTICAASTGDYVPVQYSAAAFALMAVGAKPWKHCLTGIGRRGRRLYGINWSFAMALGGSVAGITGALWLLRVQGGFQEQVEVGVKGIGLGTVQRE